MSDNGKGHEASGEIGDILINPVTSITIVAACEPAS